MMKYSLAIWGLLLLLVVVQSVFLLQYADCMIAAVLFWIIVAPPLFTTISAFAAYQHFGQLQCRLPLDQLYLSRLSGAEIVDYYCHGLTKTAAVALPMFVLLQLLIIGFVLDSMLFCALLLPIIGYAYLLFGSIIIGVYSSLKIWLFKNDSDSVYLYILSDSIRSWLSIQLISFSPLIVLVVGYQYFNELELLIYGLSAVLSYILIAVGGLIMTLVRRGKQSRQLILTRQADWCRVTGEEADWVPKRPFQKWPNPFKDDLAEEEPS